MFFQSPKLSVDFVFIPSSLWGRAVEKKKIVNLFCVSRISKKIGLNLLEVNV